MSGIFISDCTILIFTYERPDFLRRALSYWSECDVKIIVADGSEGAAPSVPDNVLYLHCPGATITERIITLANSVDTKYAVYVADDDFIGFEALERSVKFLKENYGYSSVQGLYTKFWTLKYFNRVICQPNDYSYSKNYHWNSENYAKRLIDVNKHKIMHYCYSVVTKSTLKTMTSLFDGIDKSLGNTLFEPLMAYASAISGKIKIKNHFYCARQVQLQDWRGIVLYEDFIKNETSDYSQLIRNVVSECKKQHQETEEEAFKIALSAGHAYLNAVKMKEEFLRNDSFVNKNNYYQIYLRLKNYLKLYLQMYGVMKIEDVDISFFDGNKDAIQSYYRDWERIERVIKNERINNIKY